MPLIALAPLQQRRLERLARRAGRSPEAMLKFVLRDGFDACEEDVRENLQADAEFSAGKGIPHKDAINRARASARRLPGDVMRLSPRGAAIA